MDKNSKAGLIAVILIVSGAVAYRCGHGDSDGSAAPSSEGSAEKPKPADMAALPAARAEAADDKPGAANDPFPALRERLAEMRKKKAAEEPTRKLGPEKISGPAGALARSFMTNWENKRYAEMLKQTTDPRVPNQFALVMSKSPISVRKFSVISVNATADGWDAKVSAEVTDLPSAFAACMVNVRIAKGLGKTQPLFMFGPAFMRIERFKIMVTTLAVRDVLGVLRIDLKAGAKPDLFNYALQAQFLNTLDDPDPKDPHDPVCAKWAYDMADFLGVGQSEVLMLSFESKPLHEKGLKFMRDWIKAEKKKDPGIANPFE